MSLSVGGKNSLSWEAVLEDSEFLKKIQNIESNIGNLSKSMDQQASKTEGYFKRAAASAAAFFSVQAGTDFIKSLVTTRGEFQQLEIAFSTMLKSKERADALMKDIVQFAATTPFDLKQVAAGTKQLLAYGFAADEMQQNLSMLGNIASGVGSQIGDLIYLYGTLKASGRVTQMDINQFAGRGIPVYEELAKVLQINVEQVRDFVSAGKIGFADMEQAFKNMTGTSGMFYNLMEEQSKSLTGQLSNLGDAWESMLNEIGRSQEGVFAKGIEGLATLVENYETVIAVIKSLIVVYGAYRAALIINSLATSGATAAETLHYGALVIKSRMVTLLTGKMAGLSAAVGAYTLVITAIVGAIYAWNQANDEAAFKQEKLNEAIDAGNAASLNERSELTQLQQVIKSQTATKEQQKAAYDKLIAQTGEYLKGYTLEEIALGKGEKSLESYIKKLQETAAARKALSEYTQLQDQIDSLNKNGIESMGFAKRIGSGMRAAFGKNGLSLWLGNKSMTDAIVERERDSLTGASESLKKEYEKLWEDILTAPSNDVTPSGNKIIEHSKEALKVLSELSKTEFELHLRSLSQNEQEIAAIKEKYRVLREEAKKAGLGAGAMTRIDNAEKKDIGYSSYEQETEKLKEELEKRKKAYEDYDDFADKSSKSAADQRLGHRLTEFESYGALIDSEMAKIESIMESRDLTRPEMDRLIELRKMREEEYLKEAQEENERYLRAYNAAKNHAQKILDIDKEYEQNRKALIDAGASPAQFEQLKRERDQRVSDETAANLKIENNWDRMFKKLALMSKDAAKKYLDDVEKKYKAELDAGRLTVAQFEDLMDEVNSARVNTSNPFENVIKSLEEWRKNVRLFGKDSEEAKTAFKDFAGAVAEAAGKVNQVLGEIANSIQQLGIGDENLDKALANVMGVVDGVGQIGKGIASGNPVDIIAGSIKVLTNAIELFNQKDRKLQKQIDGYKAQLESLGKAYRQLEKDIANSVGESYYDDSEKAIANMEAQIVAIERMRKAEQDKKKTDKGKIAEYDEQILSLKDSIAETQRAISEMLLQTNFKQFSQTLTDALVSAFEAGENGIDAMNDAFDDFIKNAIANAVKLGIIEPIISDMMKAATEYARNNDNSLIGFDFEKYRRDLTTAVALGQQMYNGALKDMGIEKSGEALSKDNGMAGMVGRAITEDTANKWMGVQLNIYTISKNQYAEMQTQTKFISQFAANSMQSLNATLAIERNTASTVVELKKVVDRLDSVVTNTKPQQTGRALGVN